MPKERGRIDEGTEEEQRRSRGGAGEEQGEEQGRSSDGAMRTVPRAKHNSTIGRFFLMIV